ncbi:MAG: oligosaccharide flippase family protein [Methanosphaera sp.]|nr:oligosaccharide flippase family protein [Methanosphaera sp.]
MKLYRFYYRIIGLVIFFLGILLTPFLPKLVKNELPSDMNLYVLYILNLLACVLTYWLFSYKNCLLNAFQRRDVVSKIMILMNTFKYTLQIIVLILFKNYYYYVFVMLAVQALSNIITSIIVDKIYPMYKPKYEITKDERKEIGIRIRDLFTQRIGRVINSSADTLVISSFLGLTTLAIFQNYNYVLSLPIGILSVVFESCRAGIGNSLETETDDKNYKDLRKLTFIVGWILTVCSTGLVCMYQHFMVIWTGQDFLFPFAMVILFVVYFYVSVLNMILDTFKDAAGIWHKDRYRPFCTAILNLILNIIIVNIWGIYGVLLSTIISVVVVSIPWELYNLFSDVFRKEMFEYIKMIILNIIITIVSCFIAYLICIRFNDDGLVCFIIKGIIALIVSNVIFFVFCYRTQDCKNSLELVSRIIRKQ